MPSSELCEYTRRIAHSAWPRAIELLDTMRRSQVQPNVYSFSAPYLLKRSKLGGFNAYVLRGFFTEGASITGPMIFSIFFIPVIKFHPHCFGPFPIFPIIPDSSFVSKTKTYLRIVLWAGLVYGVHSVRSHLLQMFTLCV